MNNNFINQSSYLRTTREFPYDPKNLVQEVNKSYLDVANAVNQRTIGLYPTQRPAITGNSWFYDASKRQQTLRQIYLIDSSSTTFDHNIDISVIAGFVQIYGTFTDGTLWYPLPYVDPTAANQIGIQISSTSIIINAGGTAPTITSGFVVLEWLAQP